MRKLQKLGCVAIVDPLDLFLPLQDTLQGYLAPNPVLGFDDSEAFLETLRAPDMKDRYNWLIVVADFAALSPTIKNGIFYQTSQIWPGSKKVAFTANPINPGWEELGLSKEDIIFRGNPGAVLCLLKVIKRFADNMGGTVDSTECVAPYEESPSSGKDADVGFGVIDQGKERGPEENDRQHTADEIGIGANESALHPVHPATEQTLQREAQTPPPRLEDLVRPGTRLYHLLTKEKLNFIDRFLLREISYTLFKRLSRYAPQRLYDYEEFLNSSECDRHKLNCAIVSEQLKYSQQKPR